MTSELIHDRGRGPEVIGTRITVYNLLPHLLDPTATEEYICQFYSLTQQQVAAARAYVLNHADVVLAKHMEIEAKLAVGNPPDVVEQAKRVHAAFQAFREWLAKQDAQAIASGTVAGEAQSRPQLPPIKAWLAEQNPNATSGT